MSYADVLRRNIQQAFQHRDRCAAEELLDRLREEEPFAEGTRALELEALCRFGDAADARRLARQLVELHPTSGRILYWSGRAACRERAWADAARDLRESLVLASHWSREWWLGKALTQLGRFDEAEALLSPLWPAHPQVARDLAWLWERRGDVTQALRWLDEHLAANPTDAWAQDQRTRLKAAAMGPEALRDEVETLVELGEGIPDTLFANYVEALLRAGDGAQAREVVRQRLDALPPAVAHDAGWVVYRLGAHDLATELFLVALPANPGYTKLLNALVKSAATAGRAEEVAAIVQDLARRLAPEHPHLWGYARRLLKRP